MLSVMTRSGGFPGRSSALTHVVEGLDHMQELTEIEKILPIMIAFAQHESGDPNFREAERKD